MTLNLDQVRAAAERLRGVAVHTPLVNNAELDRRLGARVFLKAENLQHIGAFKFRGAYNRLVQLDPESRTRGVVAFSSGNHAQGIAYAARLLGMQATIVMPSDAPAVKREGTQAQGAKIVAYDRLTESREEIAAEIAERTGATLVPAFDDIDVMAGQGSCGLELVEQARSQGVVPDYLLSPVGGGGLMSGVATAVKALLPECQVIGVEPQHYDDHVRSAAAGERVRIAPAVPTACDSLMATRPGELTWAVNSQLVDSFISVSEDEVGQAVSFAFRQLKLVVEPGGAVGLAALLSGRVEVPAGACVALILSGGNIDAASFEAYLKQFPSP